MGGQRFSMSLSEGTKSPKGVPVLPYHCRYAARTYRTYQGRYAARGPLRARTATTARDPSLSLTHQQI